jgi:hypothetical protein
MATAADAALPHLLDLCAREALAQVGASDAGLDAEALGLLNDTIPSDILDKALDIAERGFVSCCVGAPSGRRVFRVSGTAAEPYTCFPLVYCSCPDFFQRSFGQGGGGAAAARRRVLGESGGGGNDEMALPAGGGFLFCKHVVAVQLAQAMGSCAEHAVTDAVLGDMLCPDVLVSIA